MGNKWVSTPEGPEAIADALSVNGSMTRLDMSNNCFLVGDEEGEAVLRKPRNRTQGTQDGQKEQAQAPQAQEAQY